MINSITNDTKSVFLATTALEDFWDTAAPIVFISAGCCRYSRRSAWEASNYTIMSEPALDASTIEKNESTINAVYEDMLKHLADRMNATHSKQHSIRYWRILLGPWLYWYISVIYARYLAIKEAIDLYPELSTIGLAEESFVTPLNTSEYVQLIKTDAYNLQIYTQILYFLGIKFLVKKTHIERADNTRKQSFAAYCKDKVKWLLRLFIRKQTVFLQSAYFPLITQVQLFLTSLGRVRPLVATDNLHVTSMKKMDKRAALMENFQAQDEFTLLIQQLIPDAIPLAFIEHYDHLLKLVAAKFPTSCPYAILSANSWYCNEPFKCWAGLAMEQGAKLLGVQHGGNYGAVQLTLPYEKHESLIADKYYTWGWKNAVSDIKVKPMPAVKMLGIPCKKLKNPEKLAMMCLSIQFRFKLNYGNNIKEFQRYLEDQVKFIKCLQPTIQNQLHIRPHQEDLGWDIATRLRDQFPDITFLNWDMPFTKQISHYQIYICDHLSTTFIEAFVMNKPVLLYWRPEAMHYREKAKYFYELLKQVNILHDSPEAAAAMLNSMHHDITSWWHDNSVQEAVKMFCNEFASTPPNGVQVWNKELLT